MTTFIQKQAERHRMTTAKIKQIFGFSDYEYNNNIFNYAELYLNKTTANNDIISSVLMSKSQFWVWWKNQFNIVDELFLNKYKQYKLAQYSKVELIRLYKAMHIEHAVIPDNIICRIAGYEKMVSNKIKNLK